MATESGNPKDRLGMLKPDLALLPPAGSIEQARAQQDGARKYGPYNWRLNKVKAMIYVSAAMRHLMCFLDGEDYSRDSTYIVLNDDPARNWFMVDQVYGPDKVGQWPTPNSLADAVYVTAGPGKVAVMREDYTIVQMPVHHLGHFMACAAIVLDARANGALIDDRPTKGAANDLIAQYTLQKPPPVPERDVDAIADDVADEFHAEGADIEWHEDAKRSTAAKALQVYHDLVEQRERAPDLWQMLNPRIKAAEDLILNMVNGVFPASEANTTAADWTALDSAHEPEPDTTVVESPPIPYQWPDGTFHTRPYTLGDSPAMQYRP